MEIAELPLGAGQIGICPMPGREGRYLADLAVIRAWGPALVLTMTPLHEMERAGSAALGRDLAEAGIGWRQLPLADFTAPGPEDADQWAALSAEARAVLAGGGKVLAHCWGGCGRSGAALLRLMVEAGEAPQEALRRLRLVRPCAVERDEQFAWAAQGARP